MLLSVLAFKLP